MLERRRIDRDMIEIVGIEDIMPRDHLFCKIDSVVNYTRLYEMAEPLYCLDNG